jgi:hypothetical protein
MIEGISHAYPVLNWGKTNKKSITAYRQDSLAGKPADTIMDFSCKALSLKT